MHTAAACRQNAAYCIELAAGTKNAVHRQFLLGLAENWQQLAGPTQQQAEQRREDNRE
jgi:hypothetical protein